MALKSFSIKFFILIASNFVCAYACLAQIDSSSAVITSATPSSAETNAGLRQTDNEIYSKLKDVSDAAHHLRQTIREIIFEVTRQDYAIASEPNIVGPIVIPAIPMPTGAIPLGIFFPPRKKYMTLYAEQTHNLLTMLAEESTSLPTAGKNDIALANEITGIKKHLENLKSQNDILQQLMTGPSYNNLAIGKQAVQMSDEIDQMKKLLKDSEKDIHKDIQQTTK